MCAMTTLSHTRTRIAGFLILALVVVAGGCEAGKSATGPTALPQTPGSPSAVSLSGRVVTSDSIRLPGANVEIVDGTETGRKTSTDDNGEFQFAGLAPGSKVLRASAVGYETRTLTINVTGVETADFTLAKTALDPGTRVALSGTVTAQTSGGPSLPIHDARVTIRSGPDQGRSAATDERGRYEIADLTPADVTVEATAPGHAPRTRMLHLGEASTMDFELPREPAPGATTRARVSDVLTGAGLPGISASGPEISAATSNATGDLQLAAFATSSAAREVRFSGPGVVERRTYVQIPAPDVDLSLIPSHFDLAAFDQMFRQPVLRRWVSAPPLLVEQRVVQFTDVSMADAAATSDAMTTNEADAVLADLAWALPRLSAGHFPAFADVTRRTSPEGGRVMLLNPGTITVVWVAGLQSATGMWGWSRWLYDAGGRVTGGLTMLDRDFERSGSPYARSLRTHELGHALGYGHVTSRTSVMHPSARYEPTPFDLDAVKIAFNRQPGNESPDTDAPTGPATQRHAAPVWSLPIP
jgi:hypothetical protein